jgi:hypothetical protein
MLWTVAVRRRPIFLPGWNLHTAQEIGIDDFQANRSPDHFFEHPNQRDDQAELCELMKFCLSSEQDHVFRQFTAGNHML